MPADIFGTVDLATSDVEGSSTRPTLAAVRDTVRAACSRLAVIPEAFGVCSDPSEDADEALETIDIHALNAACPHLEPGAISAAMSRIKGKCMNICTVCGPESDEIVGMHVHGLGFVEEGKVGCLCFAHAVEHCEAAKAGAAVLMASLDDDDDNELDDTAVEQTEAEISRLLKHQVVIVANGEGQDAKQVQTAAFCAHCSQLAPLCKYAVPEGEGAKPPQEVFSVDSAAVVLHRLALGLQLMSGWKSAKSSADVPATATEEFYTGRSIFVFRPCLFDPDTADEKNEFLEDDVSCTATDVVMPLSSAFALVREEEGAQAKLVVLPPAELAPGPRSSDIAGVRGFLLTFDSGEKLVEKLAFLSAEEGITVAMSEVFVPEERAANGKGIWVPTMVPVFDVHSTGLSPLAKNDLQEDDEIETVGASEVAALRELKSSSSSKSADENDAVGDLEGRPRDVLEAEAMAVAGGCGVSMQRNWVEFLVSMVNLAHVMGQASSLAELQASEE